VTGLKVGEEFKRTTQQNERNFSLGAMGKQKCRKLLLKGYPL
jgi:hypothetical protein